MTHTLAGLKRAAITGTLRSCQLFAGMSPAELEAIAEFTAVKPVAKGGYLFHEGDASSAASRSWRCGCSAR